MSLTMDVQASNGTPFRVVVLGSGELGNYPAAMEGRPLVEFYDRRYAFTPDGQFTGARYYLSDLLDGHDGSRGTFLLTSDVPAWRIDSVTWGLVVEWLLHCEQVVAPKVSFR